VDANASSRAEQNLVAGATSRIREALGAWLEEDFDRAAASAPMAVELLGKAALWHVNPALLVPLEPKHEATLVVLASDPNLDSASMRTIGLKVMLGRLTRVVGDLPVPGKRQDRLVDCRNGSLHVGALPNAGEHRAELVARQVLTDSLALCDFFLAHVKVPATDFYGDRLGLANGLLEEQRSDLEHRVARRLAQARDAVERWRQHLGDDDVWSRSAGELEAAAAYVYPPEEFGFDMGAINQACPACGHDGRLLGRVDVDGDADVEYGPDGPEHYGFWRVTFYPRAYACNVCKLLLTDPQELAAAGVPAHEREVREDDLGDDFSASEWAEGMYGQRD
jgi:hypothetical protein